MEAAQEFGTAQISLLVTGPSVDLKLALEAPISRRERSHSRPARSGAFHYATEIPRLKHLVVERSARFGELSLNCLNLFSF